MPDQTNAEVSDERPIAWRGWWSGAGSIDSTTRTTHIERIAKQWAEEGAEVTPLVALTRRSVTSQASEEEVVAMNDPTYRSPREDAAYYGSIWSLSTNQMAELEKTFKYHRDHTELGLITQEPDSSVIESLAPLADREKSADHEARHRARLYASPSKRVERLETAIDPHAFAQEYESRDPDYTPTDAERALIEDALCSFIDVLEQQPSALCIAAQAVIDQWDTPNWKLDEPTAAIINGLRQALGDRS